MNNDFFLNQPPSPDNTLTESIILFKPMNAKTSFGYM